MTIIYQDGDGNLRSSGPPPRHPYGGSQCLFFFRTSGTARGEPQGFLCFVDVRPLESLRALQDARILRVLRDLMLIEGDPRSP